MENARLENMLMSSTGFGKSLVLITSLLGVTLGLGGCKDRPTQEKADASTPDTATVQHAEPPQTLVGDVVDPVRIHQVPLDGELDAANRYLFTVLVDATPSTAFVGALKCSGVLIAPRLVLTAGHCVCVQRGAGSNCISTATVMTMTYQSRKPGEDPRALHEMYHGVIRPHPELSIQFDGQERITSVHANLAVILLDKPMPDRISPLRLAESGFEPDELLLLSGYGSDGTGPELYGQRRFNKVQAARVSADHERVFLERSKRPLHENDSGGPCMRETERGSVLMGISNRGLGDDPTCISTYFYKEWLREEILNAGKAE